MNPPPADTDAIADLAIRERALEPDRSFIVGAPAGSGKTTLLTQRYLRLLSLVEHPESIVAITFTRKAAEEMRSRVLDALRAVSNGGGDELDPVSRHWARRALEASDAAEWRLLDHPRRLRMQTIDAFAATIARRGPLLSGFAGNARVLDDARTLYERAARATISALGSDDGWAHAVATLLSHIDNDWARLERLLAEMLGRRDQWLRFVVHEPERAAFEGALARTVGAELEACCATLPRAAEADVVRLAAFAGGNLARTNPDDARACLADLAALPEAHVDSLERWQALSDLLLTGTGTWRKKVDKRDGFLSDADGVAEHKALFHALIDELRETPGALEGLQRIRHLPVPAYDDADWLCLEALFSVMRLAAAELQLEFDRGGAVDFAHVGQAAVAALGGSEAPSELQLVLDYEVRHLLVDEFQDTSIAQFELIERLVDGWTGDDGRSLFLVGDPMQSIYRFREAEVSLFTDTASSGRLASVPLEQLQLSTNFRAQAALIDWLNGVSGALAETPASPFAGVPTLVAARPAADPNPVEVHALPEGEVTGEMQAVTDIVVASLARDPDRRIGVLVRSRSHLGPLGAQLRNAGIAVIASDIDRLAAQPVVRDLTALTRALLHPADRTAWLAILRAPWCGAGLHDLVPLFEGARGETVPERLRDPAACGLLSPDGAARITGVFGVMERFLPRAGREPIAALVESAWLALNGPSLYERESLRHAERYLDLLAANDARTEILSAEKLDALLEREYVAPPPQADAAVEIMTMHAAKGLEFDVVVLPGLGRKPQAASRRLLEWRTHHNQSGTELLFAPIESPGGGDAPINVFLRAAERDESNREAHRLLYVAMTRARERLYLVGTVKQTDDGAFGDPASGSFLRLLWPAVSTGLVPGDGAAIEPAAARIDPPLRRIVEPIEAPTESAPGAIAALLPSRFGLEFSWASPVAKHVGTVTHALLQRISVDGLPSWPDSRVAEFAPVIGQRLRAAGVDSDAVGPACARICEAVTRAINSERGRWILDSAHRDAHSEYALTALARDQMVNIVIDRTFVDEADRRWIIDYKTGVHAGGSPEAFVASEVERYRPQLDRYAEFFRRREQRELRLGLYFPLLDEWREWTYGGESPAPGAKAAGAGSEGH